METTVTVRPSDIRNGSKRIEQIRETILHAQLAVAIHILTEAGVEAAPPVAGDLLAELQYM